MRSTKNSISLTHATVLVSGESIGWYIYVPYDVQQNDSAFLESELLNTGRTMASTICFSFWYHNKIDSNNHSAQLIVAYEETPYRNSGHDRTHLIGKVNSSRLDKWINYQKTVTNITGFFKLVLWTSNSQPEKGDIAVDDISIKSGLCSTGKESFCVPFEHSVYPQLANLFPATTAPPLRTTTTRTIPANERQWDCDFDGSPHKTLCPNWKTDGNWTIQSGYDGLYKKQGPKFDHTHDAMFGRYILLTPQLKSAIETIKGASSKYKSTLITTAANGPHCFQFWFYVDLKSFVNFRVELQRDG